MLKVKITGSFKAPNLDKRWIEVPCPACRLRTPASLRDVRLGNTIICRGCKANIRLIDRQGEFHRARQRFERMFARMNAMFRR